MPIPAVAAAPAASGLWKLLTTWGAPALTTAFLAPMITGPILDHRRQDREQRLQEKALRNKALADAMLLADESRARRSELEAKETARLRQLAMIQQMMAAEDRNASLDRMAGILGGPPALGAMSVSGPTVGSAGLTNSDMALLSQSESVGNGLLSLFGFQ